MWTPFQGFEQISPMHFIVRFWAWQNLDSTLWCPLLSISNSRRTMWHDCVPPRWKSLSSQVQSRNSSTSIAWCSGEVLWIPLWIKGSFLSDTFVRLSCIAHLPPTPDFDLISRLTWLGSLVTLLWSTHYVQYVKHSSGNSQWCGSSLHCFYNNVKMRLGEEQNHKPNLIFLTPLAKPVRINYFPQTSGPKNGTTGLWMSTMLTWDSIFLKKKSLHFPLLFELFALSYAE